MFLIIMKCSLFFAIKKSLHWPCRIGLGFTLSTCQSEQLNDVQFLSHSLRVLCMFELKTGIFFKPEVPNCAHQEKWPCLISS